MGRSDPEPIDPRRARERFLETGQPPAGAVRPEIVQSWERSRLNAVNPHTVPPYEPDQVDDESRLCQAALPVLQHFAEMLQGSLSCLVLADREARGIQTWVGDRRLEPILENLRCIKGHRFSEDVVGTSGLGTPLETGRPIVIGPGEHYQTALTPLSCAGVPVRHPLTRRIEAVIDMTVPFPDPNGLLLPMTLEIARQVEEGLYAQSTARERLLLQHFLATSRGSSRGVVVVTEDMIMANPMANRLLEGVPQALLWEHAARAIRDRLSAVHELPLSENRALLVHCFPINESGRVIGAALEFDRAVEPATRRSSRRRRPAHLPGLVGRSAAWQRVCQEARRHVDAGPALRAVITGEPGVGKISLARAMCQEAPGSAVPATLDGALEASEGLAGWIARLRGRLEDDNRAPVIIAHADLLTEPAVRGVCGLLDERSSLPPLIVTMTVGERPVGHCAPLVDRVGVGRIEIPPLRQRPDDIPDLANALLRSIAGNESARQCSSETLQALTRFAWPGNVRQLEGALRAAVAQRDRGELRPDDLPQEIRRGSARGRLTPMEQAEVDAILGALQDANGNKVEAAVRLGISRSSLYRKLRAYGLELDQAVF